MTIIDTYIQKFDQPKKEKLEEIQSIALKLVPNATEVISYGMPTLQYQGKSFLGFNAHLHHIGIYPYGGEEIEIFKDEIEKAHLAFLSGALRIPYNQPIPEDLLIKIIKHRIKRIDEKAAQ